jgi:hypothetical protein
MELPKLPQIKSKIMEKKELQKEEPKVFIYILPDYWLILNLCNCQRDSKIIKWETIVRRMRELSIYFSCSWETVLEEEGRKNGEEEN